MSGLEVIGYSETLLKIEYMRILIIKSLYVPNETFMNQNINTIERFLKYLATLNKRYEIAIKIIGWVNPRIDGELIMCFKSRIESLKKTLENMTINIEFWDVNLGKKYIFRELKIIFPTYHTYNYIIYADHDISPIDDLISSRIALGTILRSKIVAIVTFHQEPDNRHNPRAYQNNVKIMDINFYYSDHCSDIASGCFITTPYYFDIFSNMRSEYVYGDEDILIPQILKDNNLINIISEKKVEHKYDNDKIYAEWKRNIILKIINGTNSNIGNDYWI